MRWALGIKLAQTWKRPHFMTRGARLTCWGNPSGQWLPRPCRHKREACRRLVGAVVVRSVLCRPNVLASLSIASGAPPMLPRCDLHRDDGPCGPAVRGHGGRGAVGRLVLLGRIGG